MSSKRRSLLHFAIVFLISVSPAASQVSLEILYREHQFFQLRDELAKHASENSPGLDFYRGITANRFNRPEESNELLSKYLTSNDAAHSREAHETIADNYIKLYEYGKAADEFGLLVKQFLKAVSKKQADDYRNSAGIFGALRTTPRQELSIEGAFQLQGSRDAAGLLTLPVAVNGQKVNFIFDTGAELSVVTASTAKALGLTIIDTKSSVGTSTDIEVKSSLAVAPVLQLGNATFRNVVFLVLEDKDLYFPSAKYQINGIVGFPVIEAFGSVTISRDNIVTGNPADSLAHGPPNMFLHELKPIVEAIVLGKRSNFAFDTGAITSSFYPRFFEANKQFITSHAKQHQRKAGGAGGVKNMMAYMLKDLEIMISGHTTRLPIAEIYPAPSNDESRTYYGNLGQDLIKQFQKMTLDFRAMQIRFE